MEPTLFSIHTSDQLVYALGWTVLHSLWQGTLLALLVGVSAAFIKKQSALTRYWTALAGLGGLLIWALLTFIRIYQSSTPELMFIEHVALDGQVLVQVATPGVSGPWATFLSYFETHLPMIVTCWLIGMSVFALRFLGGLAYVQQLKYHNNRPVDPKFQLLLEQLRRKMNLARVVGLVESTKIRVPMTIGHLKPMVLLPAGALLALSPAQVEAILAHELAHIKRNDFLINVFQSIVEVLFYYHPAVWWLSAQVRLERENCCDDIAVAACGDDLEYAKALLSLQEYAKVSPSFAMAFSRKKNHLLNRVKRILNHPINSNQIMEKFSITALILLCLLVVSMRAGDEAYEQHHPEVVLESTPQVERSTAVAKKEVALEFVSPETIHLDTLPQGKVNLRLTRNGEKIEAKMEDGQIKSLKINGAVQDKSKYEAYLPILEEVMNTPTPPLPPAPPTPGVPRARPAPAAPPAPGAPAAPPAPSASPAPKASEVIKVQQSIKVKSKEGADGNTVVIVEREDGGDPVEIKIEENGDDEKVILLNGERIDNGESIVFVDGVVVEEMPGLSMNLGDLDFDYDVAYMLNYENQLKINMDSLNRHLTTVWMARTEEQAAEFERLKAEMEQARTLSGQEAQQRIAELERRMFEQRNALKEKVIILRQQEEQELEAKRIAMEQQVLELKNIQEQQLLKMEMETQKALAEQQKANQERMIREMLKDGLIASTNNYNIVISNTMLKVNGKKQPKAIFEKYKKIYEEGMDQRSGKYKVTLKKSNF